MLRQHQFAICQIKLNDKDPFWVARFSVRLTVLHNDMWIIVLANMTFSQHDGLPLSPV